MHDHQHPEHGGAVCEKHVVKRRGSEEHYDHRKIYGSVYAAAIASGEFKSRSAIEDLASAVTADIDEWVLEKSEISSDEIFHKTINLLRLRDENVAHFYETHRDIS